MADALPTVSACIPTLGRSSLWEQAVPSLLAQGDAVQEVVIAVDGAAEAEALPAFDDPRVRVVAHDGRGVCAGRNAAAAEATGDVLYFLDDDDRSLPGAVDALRRTLDAADVVLASASMEVVEVDGRSTHQRRPEDLGGLYHHLVASFHAGTFAVRRPLFEEVGGYREDLRFGENYELGMRLAGAIHERGLTARVVPVVALRWVRSPTAYGAEQARTAELLLRDYAELMAANPRDRATYEAIVGVWRWRQGERGPARRSFARALRAAPGRGEHWSRLAVSLVPPVADRRWPAT